MLHDLVDCMYVLCYMIWLTVCDMLHDLVEYVLNCMIWLSECAMLHDLVNYVLCYMIWLTVCMCYVT